VVAINIWIIFLLTSFKVPLYDGRNTPFKMTDLHKLHSLSLPLFDGDVAGTISLVGYTANTWMNNRGKLQLSLNIQWIIVLAAD